MNEKMRAVEDPTKSQKIDSSIEELDHSISELERLSLRIMGSESSKVPTPEREANPSVATLMAILPDILLDFSKRVRSVCDEIGDSLF